MLVVDDYREVVEIFGLFLASRGYEIARAYDGMQAIETARFFRPHAIVLNLMMPVMDGDKAASWLRAHPAGKDVKIIMTSAFPHLEARCLRAGADAVLIKPFGLHELDATISRLLAGS